MTERNFIQEESAQCNFQVIAVGRQNTDRPYAYSVGLPWLYGIPVSLPASAWVKEWTVPE
ncbi:MAG: hypothetical protein ABL888_15070 [Pirellulaceae bacterium]